MRKLFLVACVALFFLGCGASASQSEFWHHNTMYKNWDHMKFSLRGYKSPSRETMKKSQKQGWWGIDIPYIPAQ